MTDLIDEHSLGWPYVERYLALRKAKRIGAVWPGAGGIYWLAPADAVNAHGQIEPIPVPKLRELIDALDPPQIEVPKKPVQTAARGTWFGAAPRVTPYFEDDKIQLFHGDCREVLPRLARATPAGFDCVVTDPPYGDTSLPWDRIPIFLQILPHKQQTKLDLLCEMRRNLTDLKRVVDTAEMEVIRSYRAQELDTTGHTIKVVQSMSGGKLMHSLIIDGEG